MEWIKKKKPIEGLIIARPATVMKKNGNRENGENGKKRVCWSQSRKKRGGEGGVLIIRHHTSESEKEVTSYDSRFYFDPKNGKKSH